MGGLEALRQRENFPNLTNWEGPEPTQPLEFLQTPLGGRFLVYESFLYRKEKAAGEKVYWMCREQARLGCRSRAITQGRRVMVMRSHCHSPDLDGLEALRQREKAPQEKAPQEKAPQEKAPKEKAPREKAPKEKAPKEKAPKEKAPKEKAPKEKAPKKARKEKAPKEKAPREKAQRQREKAPSAAKKKKKKKKKKGKSKSKN